MTVFEESHWSRSRRGEAAGDHAPRHRHLLHHLRGRQDGRQRPPAGGSAHQPVVRDLGRSAIDCTSTVEREAKPRSKGPSLPVAMLGPWGWNG